MLADLMQIKICQTRFFSLSPSVLNRNGNGLKPASLTAITTPPAASSPGLVPLTVWLCRRDGHVTLVLEGPPPEPWCDCHFPCVCVCCVLMWPLGDVLSTHSCPRDVFKCTRSLKDGEVTMQRQFEHTTRGACPQQYVHFWLAATHENSFHWFGTAAPIRPINYWCSAIARLMASTTNCWGSKWLLVFHCYLFISYFIFLELGWGAGGSAGFVPLWSVHNTIRPLNVVT